MNGGIKNKRVQVREVLNALQLNGYKTADLLAAPGALVDGLCAVDLYHSQTVLLGWVSCCFGFEATIVGNHFFVGLPQTKSWTAAIRSGTFKFAVTGHNLSHKMPSGDAQEVSERKTISYVID